MNLLGKMYIDIALRASSVEKNKEDMEYWCARYIESFEEEWIRPWIWNENHGVIFVDAVHILDDSHQVSIERLAYATAIASRFIMCYAKAQGVHRTSLSVIRFASMIKNFKEEERYNVARTVGAVMRTTVLETYNMLKESGIDVKLPELFDI